MHAALSLMLVGLVASVYARHCDDIHREWEDFKVKYDKNYLPEEDDYRMNLFAETKHEIAQHNQLYEEGKVSFTKKINRFADMLTEEASAMMNGYRRPTVVRTSGAPFVRPHLAVPLPDTVDWRQKEAVTPVKDQGQCGSCWAFSSTGALEGQHFLKTGKLVSLSEQNLVDCAMPDANGCQGGWQELAFDYIKKNGGIDTEDSYPYKASYNKCTFSKESIGATDKGYVSTPMGDEDALKAAVAHVGPIAIAIDASRDAFFHYGGGILDIPNCSELDIDHAVLIVGYGSMDGQDYWLVKNSWGTGWGDKGYVYMARNKDNMCGVASYAAYPLV